MKTYDLSYVKDRVEYYRVMNTLTNDDVIRKIKSLREELSCKEPYWYRVQKKNKENVTTYNEVGIMLSTNHAASEIGGLKEVIIHKQFSNSGRKERRLERELLYHLAGRLGFPRSKNGNLYAETKRKIEKLLS